MLQSVFLVVSATLFSLQTLCSAAGNEENATNLIVGGFKVGIEEIPYQVAVFRDRFFVCGGSLIGPVWVLTAQHCAPDDNERRYTVAVGADIPSEGLLLSVSAVYLHPKNPDDSIFDVALLKLEAPLQYGERIQCVPLMTSSEKIEPGMPAYISGYGKTHLRSLHTALRAATVAVLSMDKCKQFYEHLRHVDSYMVCAGFEAGQVDSCQGDSGGPMVINGELAGVTDWGIGCAKPNAPGVYITVGSFYRWLQSVIQEQASPIEQELCEKTPANPTGVYMT